MNGIEIIARYEAALRDAMLANDVVTLSELIDDDLVFTAPDGQVLSKDDDLDAHRARLLRLHRLDIIETRSRRVGEMVVTVTKADLAGHFGSTPIDGQFAYTRLWRASGERWRVIAGHASRIG
ncbi:nuclear transport factor 2 family protein [Burkholderia gladioli]|uniref:nuclear transport factor 2 family protein n=1 Tax=Burkholderia gladioli TaxID=28095 RepID=UPI00064AE1B1|nr:nuclear transport factor 2 family protein [Burkholderia gladioli]MDA0573779.1 nuclear transport factor 2 family protein [Burkholderia gladioli]MDA0602118.1 nuclear transport factor 2 family protein [Burkholderia gladioli]